MEDTKKVSFKIKFKEENGESVSLEQFNDFLSNINNLHKRVILLTQPEYKGKIDLQNIDSVSLLSYHELEIEDIHRENPFFLTLSFRLASFSISPYWTLWKVLIDICKKYGKNTKDLEDTLMKLLPFFEKLFIDLKIEKRDNKINSILDEPDNYYERDNLFAKIKEWIMRFLHDKKTQNIYNSFCTSSILITQLVSTILSVTGKIELVEHFINGDDDKLI
ncbi:MAG: hypothetical protein ACOYOV_10160 [Bacteroidales bacterium]